MVDVQGKISVYRHCFGYSNVPTTGRKDPLFRQPMCSAWHINENRQSHRYLPYCQRRVLAQKPKPQGANWKFLLKKRKCQIWWIFYIMIMKYFFDFGVMNFEKKQNVNAVCCWTSPLWYLSDSCLQLNILSCIFNLTQQRQNEETNNCYPFISISSKVGADILKTITCCVLF